MTIKRADYESVVRQPDVVQSGGRPATFAGAKINLGLRVVGKRGDGYHLLESLVVHAADVGDTLSAEIAAETSLQLAGEYAEGLPSDSDNLVLRAVRLLAPDRTVRLTLHKALPIASGIGGGSSDAAACLRLLNAFLTLNNDQAALRAFAELLGADVPVCVDPVPAIVTGIGEGIEPVGMPALHLVLVNPGVEVSTQAVFAQRHGPFTASYQFPTSFDTVGDVVYHAARLGNDLAVPATELQPVIAQAHAEIASTSHCLHAAMSGSGATCFGLFSTRSHAEAAAIAIGKVHPAWWVRAATTHGSAS